MAGVEGGDFNEVEYRPLHRDAFVHERNAFRNIGRSFTPASAATEGLEDTGERGASLVTAASIPCSCQSTEAGSMWPGGACHEGAGMRGTMGVALLWQSSGGRRHWSYQTQRG